MVRVLDTERKHRYCPTLNPTLRSFYKVPPSQFVAIDWRLVSSGLPRDKRETHLSIIYIITDIELYVILNDNRHFLLVSFFCT